MALLDPYVTAEEYRAAKGDFKTAVDAMLDAQLEGNSRLLELALGQMPGAWNTHTGTYTFDGHGGHILPLRDRAGRIYPLQVISTDGCGIDTELDGTYDGYAIDFTGETWLRGLPENAAALSMPYDSLEILSHRSDAEPARWPNVRASVRITGTFGWAEVPQLIKELVIHRTIELRDAHKAGSTGELSTFDGGIPMQPNTKWLFKQAEEQYGTAKIPGIW